MKYESDTRLRVAVFADGDGFMTLEPHLRDLISVWVVADETYLDRRANGDVPVLLQPATKSPHFEDFLGQFAQLQVDVIISCSYSRIIPASLIKMATLDAINIHGGLLPVCRGANILNWVLVKGHTTTGVTIHELSPGIDQGAILAQRETPIHDTDDAVILRKRLGEVIPGLLRPLIHIWSTGQRPPREPQDESKAVYYRRRTPDDGLFDWSWSDADIFNLVRAVVAPWPGAFFYDIEGRRHDLTRYHTLDEIRMLRERFSG